MITEKLGILLTEVANTCGYDDTFTVILSNRPELCDYQSDTAFQLAKKYHKAPMMIGTEIVDALKKKTNVKITHNARLVSLIGEKELEGLTFERSDKTRFEIKTPALFVAIGQVPNNGIYSQLVELSLDGYILADENMATKTKGLFVAGDCRLKKVRQLTTACSDGAIAATSASTFVQSLN